MKLSIIIVNYNSKSVLFPCLDSLQAQAGDVVNEIIIVDNASPKDQLKTSDFAEYPKVRFWQLDKNVGFGRANNFAAKKASGEYLLLLNPDTLAVDQSIQKMADFYQRNQRTGALTCLLYRADRKTLQENFFGKFQSLLGLTIWRFNYQKVDVNTEFMQTDIVTGACLLIRKHLFDKIGGFDENYFMYLEDDDLCKRLADAGYKNGVLTTAKIIHLEGKSADSEKTKKKSYYESQDYYWTKHNGSVMTAIMKLLRWPYRIFKSQ